MAISTNGTVLARLSGALYNTQLSNATYKEVAAIVTTTASLNALANDLYARDFAGSTDLSVANTLLTNLSLSSVAGLDAWVAAQITAAGAANKGAKIVELLNGFAQMTSDATYGSAAAAFNTKTTNALELSQTDGNLGGTFEAASVASSKTFTLTTGLDTGTAFTGGAGNDTFIGTSSSTATLNDGDSLVGGAGTDTLNVAVSGSTTASGSFLSSGVENVSITNSGSNAYTLDATLMSGLTGVVVKAGASASTVSAAQGIVSAELVSSSQNLTITSAAAAVVGTADATAVTLNGAATTADVALTYNGIETFNVTTTGTATGSALGYEVTLASDELETVNVSGSVAARITADLTGADASTQTAVFNASAATGAITAVVTAGASGKMSVTGGSANDSIDVGTVTKEMTVDGGAGTDTLKATGAYSTTATTQAGANVTNFEKVTGTVDQRAFPNNTFTEAGGAGSYTYVGATFATAAVSTNAALTVDRATDTTADALTVNLTATTAGTATLTVDDEESLTINSAGTATVVHTVSLTDTDLTTLTVTGANSLDMGTLTSLAVATINAGAHTGSAFTANAAASNVAMTITGSAGVPVATTDTVNTLTGGSKADNITGGAYKDVLTGGLGADTLTGAAGNDSLAGDGGNDVLLGGDGDDTIGGGTGDDSIDGGAGNDYITTGGDADTVEGGAGNDRFAVATLSDDTVITDSAGTDVLANTTATMSVTNLATSTFADVGDDAAPTITAVDTGYIQLTATAGSSIATAALPLTLDMTGVTGMTTLYLDTVEGDANSDYALVKNFSGSSIVMSSAAEFEGLTIDGTGQASLTLTLDDYDNGSDDTLAVTGVSALTISGRSTTSLTAGDDQNNVLGVVSANTANSVTVSTTGSVSAGALTMASLSATNASSLIFSVGNYDVLTSGAITATGDAAETVSVTVGTGAKMDVTSISVDAAAADSVTITVAEGGVFSTDSDATVEASDDVDLTATSIAELTVTVGSSAYAAIDIDGINVAAGVFTIGTGSSLSINNDIGVDEGDTSFTFSGRGTLVVDDGSDVTTGSNPIVILGDTATFNTTGLSTFSTGLLINGSAVEERLTVSLNTTIGGADSVTGGAGNDSISTGSGNDTVDGGAGNDTITGGTGENYLVGGADNDVITGGVAADTIDGGTGADTITLGTAASIVDVVRWYESDSVAASAIYDVSVSTTVAVTNGSNAFAAGDIITFANGVDTISGFEVGVDVLNVAGFSGFSTTSNPTALIGATITALAENTAYQTKGTWSASAGTFTISTTGVDTIMVANDGIAADDSSLTNTNWVVLIGAVTPTQVELVTGAIGGA